MTGRKTKRKKKKWKLRQDGLGIQKKKEKRLEIVNNYNKIIKKNSTDYE